MFIFILYSCTNKINTLNAKQTLGHYLFFDTRLSVNNTKSCSSCHNPQFAFSDGYRTSVTALGENVLHNSPSILNSKFLYFFDWANTNARTLAQQIKRPLYNHSPIELGLNIDFKSIQKKLQNDSLYKILFANAYQNNAKMDTTEIEECIVTYTQSLVSLQSKFDINQNKFSPTETNGMRLFFSNKLKCASCHIPPYFTTASSNNLDSVYANNGLYFHYPENDLGLYNITKKEKDKGKFKIPSLRNVMTSSPYMHDGSVASINEVIDNYARGGRNVTYENAQGDGKNNTQKDLRIAGFAISASEKQDLIQFLNTLTDTSYLQNPNFKNPFH